MHVTVIVDVPAARHTVHVRLALAGGVEDQHFGYIRRNGRVETRSAILDRTVLVELDALPLPSFLAFRERAFLGRKFQECPLDQPLTNGITGVQAKSASPASGRSLAPAQQQPEGRRKRLRLIGGICRHVKEDAQ